MILKALIQHASLFPDVFFFPSFYPSIDLFLYFKSSELGLELGSELELELGLELELELRLGLG